MKSILSKAQVKRLSQVLLVAFVLVLLIELLNRRSLAGLIEFIYLFPMVFLYNTTLVALSLSLLFFTKRQTYSFYLISGVWIALALVNMVIRTHRMTPFTLDDLQFISNIATIMPIYLSGFQIATLIMGCVLLLVSLVVAFVKTTPRTRLIKTGFINVGVISSLIFALPLVSPSIARFEETDGNLKTTFDEFGFAYSFVRSIFSRGVKQSPDFDEALLLERLSALKSITPSEKDVNVIAIQLESFFDVNRIPHFSFSQDPIPTFSDLKRRYSSGVLTVPTIGGGTANSEFEFLTSMELKHFGIGEYPYKTALREQSLPSLVSYFNHLNYSTTAIHNHSANFYRRHVVYKNLGFQTFVTLETMKDVTTTPMGWAKDKHLLPLIQESLLSSPQKDFIFAVSVQGHGDYPDTPLPSNMIEFVRSYEEFPQHQLNYFLNQLYEMDQFINDVVGWIKTLNEPTILVLYGDHLPGIDFGLDSRMEYQTDYVIVSNFQTDIIDEDLTLSQLGARTLELVNLSGTTMHQLQKHRSNHEELIQWVHYDWISGNRVSMDAIFQPLKMRIGLRIPTVHQLTIVADHVLIQGKDFLPSFVVVVNGEAKETVYISETLIMFEGPYEEGNKIEFAIRSDNRELIMLKQ